MTYEKLKKSSSQMRPMHIKLLETQFSPHHKKIYSKVSIFSYGLLQITISQPLGFYGILGSRRLSSLVVEEYQSTSEIKESKAAADTRNLILERLPLFLHEHGHARTLVSYSSLTSPANFSVKTFGKISVTKSLAIGGRRLSHKQDASAVAQRFGRNGAIQLWIAGNAQIDMYE